MSALRIDLLGGLRIAVYGQPVVRRLSPTDQALFSYLLLGGRSPQDRASIAQFLWGHQSPSEALESLDGTFERLQRIVEPLGVRRGEFLTVTSKHELGFNWESDHRLDFQRLEVAVESARVMPDEEITQHDINVLGAALDLYRGDLLPGMSQDWVLIKREQFRSIYLEGLALSIAGLERNGKYARGIENGKRFLRIDPVREDIHRAMMRMLSASGQRRLALKQYENCVRALAERLGTEPADETVALICEPAIGAADDSDGPAINIAKQH